MNLPHCSACGALRVNELAEVAPCEECGAPPGNLEMREVEDEPGWTPGELNRQERSRTPQPAEAAP